MLKKLILATILAGIGQATAAGWEYAFLTDELGTLVWDTPTQSLLAKKGLFRELLPPLKCKPGKHPRFDFFNCVGQQGWEFVGMQKFGGEDATYVFKRPKK